MTTECNLGPTAASRWLHALVGRHSSSSPSTAVMSLGESQSLSGRHTSPTSRSEDGKAKRRIFGKE
jgi:hypothetical protein